MNATVCRTAVSIDLAFTTFPYRMGSEPIKCFPTAQASSVKWNGGYSQARGSLISLISHWCRSPNGAYLMTKLNNTIKLWPRVCQCFRVFLLPDPRVQTGFSGTMKSFVRGRAVQSVQWLPNSQGARQRSIGDGLFLTGIPGILSVEGNGAVKLVRRRPIQSCSKTD